MRTRVVELLTGSGGSGPAYAAALDRLSAASQAACRTDLSSCDGVTAALRRLRTLALCWATPGTSRYGEAALLGEVLDGLERVRGVYHEGAEPVGNWWHWEIGAPMALLETCALVHDRLDPETLASHVRAVNRFCVDPDRRLAWQDLAESGANRADKAAIVALAGILGGDPQRIAMGRDGLSDVRSDGLNSLFAHVTSGDGFYADGSFIQHVDLPYAGSYGISLLTSLGWACAFLAGSPWAATDPGLGLVFDAVERGFAPFVHDGLVMGPVRGRAISRELTTDADAGRELVRAVFLLALSAPEPQATRLRGLAAGWMAGNGYLSLATPGDVALASADASPGPLGCFVFADQDRVVHRRPGWSFALALSSKRIARYESINAENLRAWHTADGMTYLYNDDLGHYVDGFWPTIDPCLMPGTTVLAGPHSHAAAEPNAWAGGASLDGVGVAGLELLTEVRGRKAWFMLDDAVIALGAGLTGPGPVVTVVENRKTDGALTLGDGWAHLDSVGGYVGGPFRVLQGERTGCWRDINAGDALNRGATTPLTRPYTTLLIDGPSYAYTLLPGATIQETARWAGARIVANTMDMQAVEAGGVFATVIWTPRAVATVSRKDLP